MRRRRKQRLNTIDKVLIVLASFLFLFITATVVIYTIKDWQYDTLITMVMSGGGAEALATAFIQVGKYKHKGKERDIEDGLVSE